MISGQLKFEQGRILFLNQPMEIVPANFFVELTKKILKGSKQKMLEYYLSAWKSGYEYMYNFVKEYKVKTSKERYALAMDIIASAGFGDYKTLEFKHGEFTHFKVFKNPVSLKFFPTKRVVDHILRGFNAGGGSIVHDTIVNCIELVCSAQNGEFCEFYNISQNSLTKINKKIINSQLNLKYLLPEQKEFISNFKPIVLKN